ncbi:hypothetical protein FB451DRAFT_1175208 [Mycena latifolia]|nr:hypothetical protein FB451DRAFT_1175208 [Mycena latifolia]
MFHFIFYSHPSHLERVPRAAPTPHASGPPPQKISIIFSGSVQPEVSIHPDARRTSTCRARAPKFDLILWWSRERGLRPAAATAAHQPRAPQIFNKQGYDASRLHALDASYVLEHPPNARALLLDFCGPAAGDMWRDVGAPPDQRSPSAFNASHAAAATNFPFAGKDGYIFVVPRSSRKRDVHLYSESYKGYSRAGFRRFGDLGRGFRGLRSTLDTYFRDIPINRLHRTPARDTTAGKGWARVAGWRERASSAVRWARTAGGGGVGTVLYLEREARV